MGKINKNLLPRKSHTRYWNEAIHPAIGWHAWQQGTPMKGATFIRLFFYPVKKRNKGVFTGWDFDCNRFVCTTYRRPHKKILMRVGWRYGVYGTKLGSLGRLRQHIRFSNPDARLEMLLNRYQKNA